MRGFFLGALILIGLDLVTTAPSSRVAQLVVTPAAWLAAWMDPHTPLISRPVPDNGGPPNNPGVPPGAGSAQPGTPPLGFPPSKPDPVKPTNGVCPAGYTLANGACWLNVSGQVAG